MAIRNIYIFLIKRRVATRRKSTVQNNAFFTQHMQLHGTETRAKIRGKGKAYHRGHEKLRGQGKSNRSSQGRFQL